MRDKTIYNCHVHILTRQHAPRHTLKLLFDDTRLGRILGRRIATWLGVTLSELAHNSWFVPFFKYLAYWIARFTGDDVWEREARFLDVGNKLCQEAVLEIIEDQYPTGTRFIILPMDMTHAKLGDLPKSIDEQHAELLDLVRKRKDTLIPFYAVDPRRPDLENDLRRNLACHPFGGVKIYPSLGYDPDDPALWPVYTLCQSRGLPIMTHCSTGGIWQYGLSRAQRDAHNHPERYIKVLEEFPDLRICLAHFGGGEEWRKHLESGREPENPAWIKIINSMITCGKYPNLYTDISYTAFAPRFGKLYFDLFDYLKVLLANETLRARVLFGSDFYMVQREELSEKEVSIALRSRLGEDIYFQIANENVKRYLGLESDQTNQPAEADPKQAAQQQKNGKS